jgi:hypothetical protein
MSTKGNLHYENNKKDNTYIKMGIPHWKGYEMGNTFIYHNKKSLCPM